MQQHDTQADQTDLDCVGWDELFLDEESARCAIETERGENREPNQEATPLVWTDTEGRLLAPDDETPWTVWTIVVATIR